MKKRMLSLTLCLLMLLSTALCVLSCERKPKTADEAWKKIDDSMNALRSYESEMKLDMTYYISGIELKGSSVGKAAYISDGEENFYYYSEMKFEVNSKAAGISQKTEIKEIYNDGKIFVERNDGTVEQKIYSENTPEEATEYFKGDPEEDIKYEDATGKTLTKNSDSSYTLVFEGYKKEEVERIQDTIGFSNDLFPNKIIDVKVTVNAGADYLVRDMKLEFVFEQDPDSDKLPLVVATTTYSKYNSATHVGDDPDVANYTAIENVKVLTDIDKMLAKIKNTKDGKFTLNISQQVKVGNNTSVYSEKDVVEYGENENGYFYDIDATVSGTGSNGKQSMDISYSSGKQTVKAGGQTQSADQTVLAAKQYINSLINTVNYDSAYVSKMEKKGDSSYKLTCDTAEPSDYKAFFEGNGGTFISAKQTMTFVIVDGNITGVKSTVEATGYVFVNGLRQEVTLSIKVDTVYSRVVLE